MSLWHKRFIWFSVKNISDTLFLLHVSTMKSPHKREDSFYKRLFMIVSLMPNVQNRESFPFDAICFVKCVSESCMNDRTQVDRDSELGDDEDR